MNSRVFGHGYFYMGLACVFFLSFFLIVSACSNNSSEEVPQDEKPVNVVTTIYPFEYFVSRIGGENVKINNLAGVGVDAHTIELTPSQLQIMQKADLLFANGLSMEPWFDRALKSLGSEVSTKTNYLSDFDFSKLKFEEGHDEHKEGHDEHKEGHDEHKEGHDEHKEGHDEHKEGHDEHKEGHDEHKEGHDEHKEGHDEHKEGHDEHAHGEFDPHIWLDPNYAIKQSKAILDVLSANDPSNANYYLENFQKLEQDLQSLHREYINGLSNCKHEEFVISHAAFGYIAARYNLTQIEIAGLAAHATPSPARVAEITQLIGNLGLGSVLVETLQVGNSISETLAKEVNVKTLPIHVIATVTVDELNEHTDYMGLMRNNLNSLKAAMECNA